MTTSQLRSAQCPLIRVYYICGAALILGLALSLNAAAQARVVTPTPKDKPTIKLDVKLPDLWTPTGTDCRWPSPAWNSTDGIFYLAVGNRGNTRAPSSSLRVREKRGEWDAANGPWDFYKDWVGNCSTAGSGATGANQRQGEQIFAQF